MLYLQARIGSEDEVLMQHTVPHLEALQATVAMTTEEHKHLAQHTEDVYFNKVT